MSTFPDRRPPGRPRDHFTPRRGWLNDPNGLVHHEGEYHLFFQHSPDTIVWGPMSWGHAVSTDLVEWSELPVALPSTEAEHMWSGSVVHDVANSSGLGTGGTGPLVALFTSRDTTTGRQSQHLAHSVDDGRTWEPHASNPVLDIGSTAFRDPKVIRQDDRWLMVLVLADERTVETYRSSDLLHWEHAASFGPEGSADGVWECPDLVRVPVEGTDAYAHVLLVSVLAGAPAGGCGTQYFVGTLEGDRFRSTQRAMWMDHGADFYAAVSYSGSPGVMPVVQAWMSNWLYADRVPATDFRGSMTVARRLTLRRRGDTLTLVQHPVVRQGLLVHEVTDTELAGVVRLPVEATACRLVAEVEPGTSGRFELHVRVGPGERTVVWVDWTAGLVGIDRTTAGATAFHPQFAAVHTAPAPPTDGPLRLEVVVDLSSVEAFIGDGERVLTDQVFPGGSSTGLAVAAHEGAATLHRLAVYV
ncbi:MAG: GH32 [uncultured Nocardioides sp.]|uniref:GH32 n=1 Tax=uncultured Nocardioides sp. TaxID=198441 RepID=A0A6J4N3P5_9ACTN|nr:MAG: GH32 [uncultured Nocardioides sp.]